MSSRVLARRGGKSLASSAAKTAKRSPLRISLLPKGPIRSVPFALRKPTPLQQTLMSLPKPSQRSFSTLLRFRDVILQRPNPVVAALPQQNDDEGPSVDELHAAAFAERKPIGELPDFSLMEAHHFEPAARQAQADYEAALAEFEKKLQVSQGSLSYNDIVTELDRIEAPLRVVSNMCAFLHHVQQDPVTQIALDAAARQLFDHHKMSRPVMEALQAIEAALLKEEDGEAKRRRLWAVRYLLDGYDNMGLNLEEEDRKALESIREALVETEKKFSKDDNGSNIKPATTREKLEDIYYILSLRAEEAKRLGFDSYAEMAFQSKSRMASSVDEVRALHNEIMSRVLPVVSSASSISLEDEVDLRSFLTLDGVLGGLFGLSRALFGVVVHEETEKEVVNGWHKDVRLFHVFDEDNSRYLGSFYLDPYRRQLKSDQPFVASILEKSGNSTVPVVCLNCSIKAPVWDHMPTEVTLDDAQSLFHEFGHVLQHLIVQDDAGGVFGANNMQLDAEEIISQFMEHWLFQESVLQSLAQLSQADEAIPNETVEKLMKERSEQKAHEIVHRVFLSELEFELFSGLGNDDSVVSVLRRVADKYRAHDTLHKSDMSPLLELLAENVRGERVTRYRYLWSEVMSADAFNVFEEAGLANEADVKRLGRLFRECFLDPGASVDTREAFKRFRGRDVSPNALLDMYGY